MCSTQRLAEWGTPAGMHRGMQAALKHMHAGAQLATAHIVTPNGHQLVPATALPAAAAAACGARIAAICMVTATAAAAAAAAVAGAAAAIAAKEAWWHLCHVAAIWPSSGRKPKYFLPQVVSDCKRRSMQSCQGASVHQQCSPAMATRSLRRQQCDGLQQVCFRMQCTT